MVVAIVHSTVINGVNAQKHLLLFETAAQNKTPVCGSHVTDHEIGCVRLRCET